MGGSGTVFTLHLFVLISPAWLLQWSSQTVLISISEENWKISMKQSAFNYRSGEILYEWTYRPDQSGLSFLPGLFRSCSIKEGADINDMDCSSIPWICGPTPLPSQDRPVNVINFTERGLYREKLRIEIRNIEKHHGKNIRLEKFILFPGKKPSLSKCKM